MPYLCILLWQFDVLRTFASLKLNVESIKHFKDIRTINLAIDGIEDREAYFE